MTTNIQKIALPLVFASSLLLTACSNDSETPAAAKDAPAAQEQPAAAQATGHLTKEQVSSNIEQIGSTTYNAADDNLTVKLKISNKGTAAWPAAGANPVTVGVVQLLAPAPGTADPTRGQEARAPLAADVQPNGETEVTAIVPGAFAVGNKVQFELVQEGVAWFGFNFQQPVVVVGPFARCADGKGLCDDKGAPIAAATP
ncbi:TPA: hypothetical protein ACKP5X_000724 [Stenotrophomonas maltophilia]|uniref:hypothetical protein n=1 Tax=Stenotrophomonas maltophilia group TaxID=995085 RepID=UPI001312BDA0|nr:hypothetical protein [Stenotrophomonas maltophilia]HEL3813752.1 hypothetical protein [Stenotrophomonas maltophilia]